MTMSFGLTADLMTSDPDIARNQLSAVYCPHSLSIASRSGRFAARHFSGGFPGLGVHMLDYADSSVEVTPIPFEDFVLVSRPIRGIFAVASGDDMIASPQDAIVMDAHGSYRLRWGGGCQVINLVLERSRFESVAGELMGTDEPAPVRFELGTPVSLAAARSWAAVTRLLMREILPSGVAMQSPLVRTQILRLTVAALLEAYPGTFMNTDPVADWAGAGTVRRAVAFMELSADQDITLANIADAARTSVRGLQRAFRSHRGTTPLRQLREIRLRRAHEELVAASRPGECSIADVAYRWGFSNASRFADEHRRAYGSLPSEILRNR